MSEEHKTLGQVCFEEMWQAQHAATGASVLHWAGVRPAVRLWWEAAAEAVKAAVLAEQEAPAEPQGMAHATTMRDHAIRELKEAVQDISRACVYRDALAAALEATAGRQKTGKKGRKRNE